MKEKPQLDHAETLYETIDESLNYLYEMAVNKEDISKTEGFSQRYGDKQQINSGASKNIYQVFDYKTERNVAMACPKIYQKVRCKIFLVKHCSRLL